MRRLARAVDGNPKLKARVPSGAMAELRKLYYDTAAADKSALRLRAFAVNLNSGARAAAGTLDINIERWSTPEEAARLRDILKSAGMRQGVEERRLARPGQAHDPHFEAQGSPTG